MMVYELEWLYDEEKELQGHICSIRYHKSYKYEVYLSSVGYIRNVLRVDY